MVRRVRRGEEFWRKHDSAWSKGELTQAEYCERHELSLKTFARWRGRFRSGEGQPLKCAEGHVEQLVPVRILASELPKPNRAARARSDVACVEQHAGATVTLDGRWRIDVHLDTPPEVLDHLLLALLRVSQ